MGWESNLIFKNFPPVVHTAFKNGSSASSTPITMIGAAQNFVASVGVDATSFVTTPMSGGNTNNAKFKVTVPPFVTHMGFAFLWYGPTTVGRTESRIFVSCSETSKKIQTPQGWIVIDTPNQVNWAKWHIADGATGGITSIDESGALEVVTTQSDQWLERTLELEVEAFALLYSAYYWFIPPTKMVVP
jgi:hypothetical protein